VNKTGTERETNVGTKVGEIVQRQPVYVVQENNSVLDAARYMTKYQIGAVPVLAEEDVVGIISERDVMIRVVAQGINPASTKVGEIMTKKVAVLGEDYTYKDALTIMEQLHIRHLPVMAGRRLVGCVSIRKLREAEAEIKEAKIEFLDNYIEEMENASWGRVKKQ
jgi:CBS domain-containing protein